MGNRSRAQVVAEAGLPHILVTGAGGFIGDAVCHELLRAGHRVRAGVRRGGGPARDAETWPLGDIGPQTDWSPVLAGIDCVVHLATSARPPANTSAAAAEAAAIAALVRASGACGIRRLVHLSSIRAMGETAPADRPLRAADPPEPADAYGRAKLGIEIAATNAARAAGLDLVILRPPMVYGPGVKGNFRALLTLAASGLPLPFAALTNRRSLIFRDNLASLVARTCTHPGAAGRILLARDIDLSVPEIIAALEPALGGRVKMFALGAPWWAALRLVPVIGPALRRLALPFLVDDAETRRTLGWEPPVAPEEGLAATARAFAGRG